MNEMTNIKGYADRRSWESMDNVSRSTADCGASKVTAARDVYLARVDGSGGAPKEGAVPARTVEDARRTIMSQVMIVGDRAGTTPEARAKAAAVLGKICAGNAAPSACRTVALPVLTTALTGDLARVRNSIANALGAIGDASSVRPLLRVREGLDLGGSEDLELFIIQLGALRKNTQWFPYLLKYLDDREQPVRNSAIHAAGMICSEQGAPSTCKTAAAPRIMTALGDTATVLEALGALGHMKEKGAVPRIITLLAHKDAEVRGSAAEALGGIKDVRAVMPLIAKLKDGAAAVRRQAAAALGEIGDVRAVPLLINMLVNDEDYTVRAYTANAVGQFRDKRAVPALIRALEDEDEDVRSRAASALGEIGDARAVAALKLAKNDSDPDVRKEATAALVKIQKDNRPYVKIPQ